MCKLNVMFLNIMLANLYLAYLPSAGDCVKCWESISGWPVIRGLAFEEGSDTQTHLQEIKVKPPWSENVGFPGEGHRVLWESSQGRCSFILLLPFNLCTEISCKSSRRCSRVSSATKGAQGLKPQPCVFSPSQFP